jgi:ribonuclease HI
MSVKSFICADFGHDFQIAESILARYPGWVPRQCSDCRGIPGRATKKRPAVDRKDALARFKDGPDTGVFTDGYCEPNPGAGGWGAVKVVSGNIVDERFGAGQQTTNNRMELTALIEGYKMVGPDEDIPVYSDSELCINTITKWATAWKQKGWKKKGGEIKNLDLVRELYELFHSHPGAKLEWVRGHSGLRWNEYADALSRAHKEESALRHA